ncbi:SH3 domain-containing protein [Clostridium sp. MCC353]|uniref:SH3 domain-containing protein n=1 Tax=Clostridium sp. MCC353 TaxID=2592646 RepID=UPI001C015466|nr:SH3 domain-containing protein [Clostridium sp. MCC353]MBT9778498.1 SH3 domain-containing protein [Clostridium sp. MCC353]
MKICSKCGAQLRDDAKFCTKCGNVIAGQADPAGPDSGRKAAAPQRQAAPQGQSAPQRQAAPQGQSAPQRQAAPQGQAAPQRQAAPQGQAAPQRQPAPQPEKKKSAKPFIIVCCVLIALMVIGTGAFVAVNMRKPASDPAGIGVAKEEDSKTSEKDSGKEEKEDEKSSDEDETKTSDETSADETSAVESSAAESSAVETSAVASSASQTSAAETESTPVFAQSQASSGSAADWTYPETTAASTMPATMAANVSYVTYYVVNCNESITLRTSPSTSAGEICQIPLGSAVSYVETADNGFYKIIYNGKTGYGLASYLSQDKPSTTGNSGSNTGVYRTFYVVNCNESITLRTSPSTSASEICQIPLGSAVSYVETSSNGFYKVIYNGNTGYALASYLEEY